MNKQQMKDLMKELRDNSISMQKFLGLYCGIYSNKLINAKISHDDIKNLIPDLKRLNFENILNNKKDIYIGKVIIVKDSYGNVAPYIRPILENEILPTTIEIDTKTKKEKVKEIIINENLSTYELSELCKKYKRTGKMREYRIAYALLKNKKDNRVKQYKKEKKMLEMKGREL